LLAEILKIHPKVSGTLFDLPQLVQNPVYLTNSGLDKRRWATICGDFFQSVPKGGDVYLLKRILHDWSDEKCVNTIVYEPVVVNGKNFLTLYISAQHKLATDVSALIDQQKYFTTLRVTIIGVVAFIIAFLVFSWNKRLETVVNARTAELREANEHMQNPIPIHILFNYLISIIDCGNLIHPSSRYEVELCR
jgi:hypothetical protein